MELKDADIYVRSGIYGFIMIFGIVGNIFVMFFFGFKMKRAANFRWFVIHLAIADCTYSIMTPVQMLYLMISGGEWHLGQTLCKMTYIGPITVNVSALILCFMAYERFRAICHPFKERLTKRFINMIVFGIWFLCILLKVPVMNRLQIYDEHCLLLSSNALEHVLIALSFLVFESILPLLLLTIFFFRITCALKESDSFRNNVDTSTVLESRRRRSSTPSFYSGMGAPPTPKWKPPLSPPPLITLDENESEGSIDYINFTHAHRRGRQSELKQPKNGVHFAFHRGRLYSGNSSCPDDVFESLSEADANDSNTKSVFNSNPSSSNSSENLVRASYSHLKKFVKHHSSHRPSLDVGRRFGIRNKKDRDIISALFYSVLMFALTSVPYNINYFVITCIYLYSPDVKNIDQEHGKHLVMLNEWLGVLMLSGSIMNIIVYSGKFPQFRFQMYAWISGIVNKISGHKPRQEPLRQPRILKSRSSMVQTFLSEPEKSRSDNTRNQNDYIKV
ncbi:neuropeptide Y receptor type 5-like [Clytia hemisphaerica]|uniref:G-protein coupled receptors family 1 profile domain-containing protein n=1 Tax=Clytia hemisphaerica TaxID=252671 RepID=A0A7M5XJE4_9CNID|eukprot:TCONS_00008659-protein